MKTLSVTLLGIFAAVSLSLAQTTVSETTTVPLQSVGTVTTFDPTGSIILTTSEGTPVTYGYSKTTTVVDEAGNPVAVDVIKSGVTVVVYYSGDQRTVSKIIVRKAVAAPVATEETTTTTTTTTK